MPLPTPCLEWHLPGRTPDGYGFKTINKRRRLAHRVAYCKANGLPLEAIDGKVVRHMCDNPSCVNPEHLELGTHADNMRDKVLRGRIDLQSGENHYRAKLSESAIQALRERYAAGDCTQQQLATEFGVNQSTISQALRGVSWKRSRTTNATTDRRKGSGNHLAKLTEDDVREIRRRCAAKEGSQKAIAAEFGIVPSLVSMIHLRKVWTHVV